MTNTLHEIISIPQCYLTLVAGESGLHRKLKWTVSIEVIDYIDYVNQGDLVFVTGIAMRDEDQLLLLTHLMFDRRASGIVFAPGPYIAKIPESIIDFGNKYNFPILSIPWEAKITNISHAIGEYLLLNNDELRQPHEILKSILLKDEPLPLSEDVKIKLGYYSFAFHKNSSYRILLLKPTLIENHDNVTQPHEVINHTVLERVQKELLNSISQLYSIDAIPIQLTEGIAFLLTNSSSNRIIEEEMLNELQNISCRFQERFSGVCVRIGIGNQYHRIEDIGNSYHEALCVTDILTPKVQEIKALYRYDQMGAYRVICENENVESMERFYKDVLGPLVSDEVNKKELLGFLYNYFDYNGNVGLISKHLFLHRNTVLYKIKKIEKILGCDFFRLDDLLNLRLALIIHNVFHNKR